MQLLIEFVQHFSGIAVIAGFVVGPLYYDYRKHMKRLDNMTTYGGEP